VQPPEDGWHTVPVDEEAREHQAVSQVREAVAYARRELT
jgi:hypothetical protein